MIGATRYDRAVSIGGILYFRDSGPFISVPIQSRQVFSAVTSGNIQRMKEMMDSDNVFRVSFDFSCFPYLNELKVCCILAATAEW